MPRLFMPQSENLKTILANARVAKFVAFDFLPASLTFLNTLHIFPISDYYHFAVLQSAHTRTMGIVTSHRPLG